MNDAERARFDELLRDAISSLPPGIQSVIEEIPLIIDDAPDEQMMASLAKDGLVDTDPETGEAIGPMGLHTGIAITESSVEDSGVLPTQIHLFREAIVEFAGGWDQPGADDEVYEEIRITLLHEIGHHFGLGEEDIDGLGYA